MKKINDFLFEIFADNDFCQVQNPDTGKKCQANELGEICVKNSCMMKGYLNRPKETEEYFDEEGFGHTGDLGFYDDDGLMHYVDRMKELIK